ncbi:MAG TPA: tetratricopeptide repeat protein [Flavipsychrobacter sp.]|nr:tetratricopeptide repeat protein [Flavipsychrobacter sp.]
MRQKLLLFLSFLFFYFQLSANVPYNAWWQKGNIFYQEKNFDSAAFYYEKLTALETGNAEVFYNLGNTYYKLNKIGLAVLNYEKALKLNPDYKQAQDNLELTQSRISNRIQQSKDIFFVTWWKGITKTSFAATWSVISLVLFLLILSFFVARKWNKTPSWLPTQMVVIAIVLCLCTLLFAYVSSQRTLADNRAVVMQQDTPLRDNLKSANTKTLIPEGTVLKVESEASGWVNVKLPDGRAGWIRKEALERI